MKKLLVRLLGIMLDEVSESEVVQGFFYDLGQEVAKTIPGNVVEDNIKEALDDFSAGLIANHNSKKE